MLLPLSAIGRTKVEMLFRAWLANDQKLGPVIDLLLGTIYNPRQYVQSTFLSLAQAQESFHRRLYEGVYVSEEDYAELLTELNQEDTAALTNTPEPRNFVRTVAAVRNYLTHYETEKPAIVENTLEMYNMNQRLRVMHQSRRWPPPLDEEPRPGTPHCWANFAQPNKGTEKKKSQRARPRVRTPPTQTSEITRGSR